MSQKTTLVTGGNGKTGARVARRLASRGMPVRIGSRRGTPAFSWEDPSTWSAAASGCASVYLAYQPDLAAPGAAEVLGAFAETARKAGVGRAVLLSGRGEPQATVAEDAVRAAGLDLTILRCSWFMQNFDEGHLHGAIRSGTLALPAGSTAEPFIDVGDIADVAVAALLDDAHIGEIHELTGPRLLTFAEVASEISAASGRAVAFANITTAELASGLSHEMPAEYAAFFADLFTFLLDGHNASTTDAVERILGRKARDFRAYARDAAKAWQ